MKVAICIGHNHESRGAVGTEGVAEYTYYKELAPKISCHGVDCKVFEEVPLIKSYSMRMRELHGRIDEWGADVSIALHFNAEATGKADGHEVLYCSRGGERVAQIVNSKLSDHLGNRDRGIKKRSKGQRGGGFLCQGSSMCVIIEPYFSVEQEFFMKGNEGYNMLKEALEEAIAAL